MEKLVETTIGSITQRESDMADAMMMLLNNKSVSQRFAAIVDILEETYVSSENSRELAAHPNLYVVLEIAYRGDEVAQNLEDKVEALTEANKALRKNLLELILTSLVTLALRVLNIIHKNYDPLR